MNHCESHNKNATYMSGIIQNVIISTVSNLIINKISERVLKHLAFTIIANETLDRGKKEQMTICLRYVIKDLTKGIVILEDPVRIIDLIDNIRTTQHLEPLEEVRLTGKNMGTVILNALTNLGLDLQKCIGQCYDGASSMSSEKVGVVAEVKKYAPNADYIHCFLHNLNLGASSVVKDLHLQHAHATVQALAVFF